MISITSEEIDLFSKYVFDISGIQLDQTKGYLLESRLSTLLTNGDHQSYRQLLDAAKRDSSGSLKEKIIDGITTNETYFFRDNAPFELLRNKIIPDLIDRRQANHSGRIPIRIWCAACSTGQEVFSIGMCLLDMGLDRGAYDITILGTDISDDAVARASYGKYNQFEIDRGLPKSHLNRYFTQVQGGWRIKDEVRTLAKFEKYDLMQPFGTLGRFDIVFCRNVAIYFGRQDKIKLFNKISGIMEDDGSLLVGSSESLSGLVDAFEPQYYLKSVFYQLKGQGAARPVQRDTARPPIKPVVRKIIPSMTKVRPATKGRSIDRKRPAGLTQTPSPTARPTSRFQAPPSAPAVSVAPAPTPPITQRPASRSLLIRISSKSQLSDGGGSLLGSKRGVPNGGSSLLQRIHDNVNKDDDDE